MGALALATAPPPPPQATGPRLLSLSAAAKQLGVSPRLLNLFEKRGQLKLVRLGGRVLVPASEVERLAREGAPLPERE